jgi:hypothetical protein
VTRYYCHVVHNGVRIEDDEGEDFPDIASARLAAADAAKELAADSALRGGAPDSGWLEIADGDGTVLAVVHYPGDQKPN